MKRSFQVHDRNWPLNTSGGQLSAGQAGAAGGLHGFVEAANQLRRRAGDRQVDVRTAAVTGYGMVLYRYGAVANLTLVCERCHGTDLRTAEMSRGRVEQMTTISTGEHIATVRVADGVPVVVRATHELHPGAAVELDEVRAPHGARAIEARPLEGTV